MPPLGGKLQTELESVDLVTQTVLTRRALSNGIQIEIRWMGGFGVEKTQRWQLQKLLAQHPGHGKKKAKREAVRGALLLYL